jgi:hypothetical protein
MIRMFGSPTLQEGPNVLVGPATCSGKCSHGGAIEEQTQVDGPVPCGVDTKTHDALVVAFVQQSVQFYFCCLT